MEKRHINSSEDISIEDITENKNKTNFVSISGKVYSEFPLSSNMKPKKKMIIVSPNKIILYSNDPPRTNKPELLTQFIAPQIKLQGIHSDNKIEIRNTPLAKNDAMILVAEKWK